VEDPSKERPGYRPVAPAASLAPSALDENVLTPGLEPGFLELEKPCESWIHGRSARRQMHSRGALVAGERVERLNQLGARAESPVLTPRDRAARARTDAVSPEPTRRIPDEVDPRVRSQFNEKELVDLTGAIVAIRGCNRMSFSFRGQPELPTQRVVA
jgi:alkylhydroperoxidase family enzyme